MGFENETWLFGLLVLIPLTLLFVAVVKWKQKTKKAFGEEKLIDLLIDTYSPSKFRLKFIISLVALSFSILALANLRLPVKTEGEKTTGIDIMFVLDVSKSMLATDLKPNRLERAKQLVSLLIDRSENNRIGIVLFAGSAFLQMPLTPDLSQAKMYLANANTDAIATQGTDIAQALTLANKSLDTKERKHKAIVLITDGEDHEGGAVSEAKNIEEDGVVIYTIGVGSETGAYIPEPVLGGYKTDRNGKTITTKLNSADLQKIASATNGQYLHLDNPLTAATTLNKDLNKMEKKMIITGFGGKSYFYFLPFILAISLVLLIIEMFITEKRKTHSQQKQGKFGNQEMKNTITLLLLLVVGLKVSAQDRDNLVYNGNRAYEKADYTTATKYYEDALSKDPKNAIAKFNLAMAFVRQRKMNDAIRFFAELGKNAKETDIKAKAWYNKGVAEARQHQLQNAIESFKKALLLQPDDRDTKENLQKAIVELRKQQKTSSEKESKPIPKPKERKDANNPAALLMDQKFNELRDKEKQLQKMLQQKPKVEQPEKDW